MSGLTDTGARLVLNNIAIYCLMQYFKACNKYIAHIFDILLYCAVEIVCNIFIRVVFPVLYHGETTPNAEFKRIHVVKS